LLTRLEALENDQRARGAEVPGAIARLMDETTAVLEQIARTVGVQCANGHAVPKGERFCPECRDDTWSLAAASSGGRR
jgi:hypothetical protein